MHVEIQNSVIDDEGMWRVVDEVTYDDDDMEIDRKELSRVPYLSEKEQELRDRIVELEKLECRIAELEKTAETL